MKFSKEKIDTIISNVINDNVVTESENFANRLYNEIKSQDSFSAAVSSAMQCYYVEVVSNIKSIMVDSLYELLNEEN